MSKTKRRVSSGSTGTLLIALGVSACGAESTFSSSSNWLKCRSDSECVAAFGVGSCSSDAICVDANNQPITRDRQLSSETPTDAGAVTTTSQAHSDGSNNTQPSSVDTLDASAPTSLADASTPSDTSAANDTSSVTAEAGLADAQSVCASACDQTDPFVLPLALCEDWNVFRDNQAYEFCDSRPTSTCEQNCIEAVTQSSTSCSESLPAVVSCVAADGFYNNGATASPVVGCLFPACQAELLQMASACSRRNEEWQAAKDLWLQSGVTSYHFQFAESTIQVAGETVTVVEGQPLDSPPSVADLFATIEASLSTPERPIIVTYDAMLGYPMRLRSYDLVQAAGCASAAETVVSDFTID